MPNPTTAANIPAAAPGCSTATCKRLTADLVEADLQVRLSA